MFLFKIAAITNVIAFLTGIIFYKNFPKEIRTIFYFVVLGVLTQLYMKLHEAFIMKNTVMIGHFYYPIAFLLLGIFYIQVLKDFVKPIYLISVIVLLETYCFINSFFIQSIFEYPSVEVSIVAMILFLFSILWFTKVMVEGKIVKLSSEPVIWINSAILIYYAGSFFYHSFYNLIVISSIDIALLVAKLFTVLNLLFYSIITVGFLKVKRINQKKVC